MTTQIDKLYFMFHPVCWASAMNGDQPPPDRDRGKFLACLEWEKQVNERQKVFISNMKPNQALIIFPISTKQPMLEIEEHARNILGKRCIIINSNTVKAVNAPAAWQKLASPIESFINDDNLEGKADFLRDVPPEIHSELVSEIKEAGKVRGYNWSIAVLKVIYYNRLSAMYIQKQFQEQGLYYDANTIESEAFGEGFEQCAVTWKAMLVPYLGLARPADNIFDLSVSGAPFLLKAKFRERVKLSNDVRLFLWEGEDNHPIGLYVRSWCRLKDPQFYARIPLERFSLEVWDLSAKCWPAEKSSLKSENGFLNVPALNGIRRDAADGSFYLIGTDISFEMFRRRLMKAEISE